MQYSGKIKLNIKKGLSIPNHFVTHERQKLFLFFPLDRHRAWAWRKKRRSLREMKNSAYKCDTTMSCAHKNVFNRLTIKSNLCCASCFLWPPLVWVCNSMEKKEKLTFGFKFYYSLSYKTVAFQTSLRSYGSLRKVVVVLFILFSFLFLRLSSKKIKRRFCVLPKVFQRNFCGFALWVIPSEEKDKRLKANLQKCVEIWSDAIVRNTFFVNKIIKDKSWIE